MNGMVMVYAFLNTLIITIIFIVYILHRAASYLYTSMPINDWLLDISVGIFFPKHNCTNYNIMVFEQIIINLLFDVISDWFCYKLYYVLVINITIMCINTYKLVPHMTKCHVRGSVACAWFARKRMCLFSFKVRIVFK